MTPFAERPGPVASRTIQSAAWIVLLTGLAWVGLGWWLDPQDILHPLRAWRYRVLIAHGVSAYVLVWLAGCLFPLHQRGNWRARRKRASGLTLGMLMLALALTGLTLYYPPLEDWRAALSLVHQGLGAAMLVALPLHVRAARRAR